MSKNNKKKNGGIFMDDSNENEKVVDNSLETEGVANATIDNLNETESTNEAEVIKEAEDKETEAVIEKPEDAVLTGLNNIIEELVKAFKSNSGRLIASSQNQLIIYVNSRVQQGHNIHMLIKAILDSKLPAEHYGALNTNWTGTPNSLAAYSVLMAIASVYNTDDVTNLSVTKVYSQCLGKFAPLGTSLATVVKR